MNGEDEDNKITGGEHTRRDGDDALYEETTMRRETFQENATSTCIKRSGSDNMDDGETQKELKTNCCLLFDETEESTQSATGTTNDVGNRTGT